VDSTGEAAVDYIMTLLRRRGRADYDGKRVTQTRPGSVTNLLFKHFSGGKYESKDNARLLYMR
jgi:hypothetical protein